MFIVLYLLACFLFLLTDEKKMKEERKDVNREPLLIIPDKSILPHKEEEIRSWL